MRRHGLKLGAGALASLAIVACGGNTVTHVRTVHRPASGASTPAGTTTTPTTPTTASTATTPTTTTPTTTTPTTTTGSTAPQTQQTAKVPGTANATVDIAVLSLRVHGMLATLSVRFTPHFPDQSPSAKISLADISNNSLAQQEVSLIDPVGLKRYLVVQDSSGTPLGSNANTTQAANGAPVTAYYTFPAPPASVTKIDVALGPFPTFADIPIQH